MKARVYYPENYTMYLLGGPGGPPMPTRAEMESTYALVWEKDEMPADTRPDDLFAYLQDRYIKLPEGVTHTSMSIGDVVALGEVFYICVSGGWKILKRKPADNSKDAILRYPRLTGHLICESLGYFTPQSAANAIAHYITQQPFCCEWYVTMARGYDDKKVIEVGANELKRAFQHRHHHTGYMAHYPQAQQLVEIVRAGGQGPIFASWF